jgi:hypothetical protein
MDARELRIGNWVQTHLADFAGGKYKRVDGNIIASYDAVQNASRIVIGDISPIPLTPEILEKAGFVKQNNGWVHGGPKGYLVTVFSLYDNNMAQGELDLQLNGSNLPMPNVKYLHQLQNLYFALTGEELNIEL